MAIFSSPQSAQTISAPPLPVVTEELPRIIFSGTDCRTITVTLENTVTYTNNALEEVKVRMLKVYTVNSTTPQSIGVEVKMEIVKNSQQPPWQPLQTFFSITIDPHLRDGGKPLEKHGYRQNPPFFKSNSAQPQPESDPEFYELYTLRVRRINPWVRRMYELPNQYARPSDNLETYVAMVEFNKQTSSWSYIELSTLLSDLLERCPSFFLQLYIVGNYEFPDINTALDKHGAKFQVLPTGFTDPDEDKEAQWDQFLLARAESMKKTIFGTRELGIKTLPAIKIAPDASGTEKVVYWNELANLFQLPDGSPDIPRLKQLNLQKGTFPAGSIFLWISLNLFDVEVLFQPDKALIYPTAGKNWQEIRQNNRKKLDKLRQTLAFLVEGANNDFITNITDVGLLVEGHTDREADDEWNQKLSKERAAAVINELVNPDLTKLPAGVTKGIDISKFKPQEGRGYGETRPCVMTPDEKPEQRNRRVLVRVVSVVCTPP